MNKNDIQAITDVTDITVVTTPVLSPVQGTRTTPGMAGKIPPRSISGIQNGTQSEQLAYYENIVTQSLASEDVMADALAHIYIGKLYELTGLTFRDFVKGRWDLSKSRAFQLIKYAKLKAKAQANGKTPPANERAARNLDADGNPLPAKDNYGYWLNRTKIQLKSSLAKLTPDEKRKYIADLFFFLNELGKTLSTQSSELISKPVTLPSKPTGGIQATVNAPIQQMPATQTISQSSGPIPPAPIPPAGGNLKIQTPLAATVATISEKGVAALPSGGPGTVQPQPNSVSYGGVTPMTMAEAKSKGLIK